MTASRFEISTLVGSRICHDLINPIGAIGNGIELLGMSQPGLENCEEMQLIRQSLANASARIQYYRVAFGAASQEQSVGARDLQRIVTETLSGGRISLDLGITEDCARTDAKLALLLILSLETALPRGGTISVQLSQARRRLVCSGPQMAVREAHWQALTDPARCESFAASDVQFILLAAAASDAGRALSVDLKDEAITITF